MSQSVSNFPPVRTGSGFTLGIHGVRGRVFRIVWLDKKGRREKRQPMKKSYQNLLNLQLSGL
jgi:hypothetical protein